ncbi:MAG: glycosyltransferase family 39 protein, partial [Chloroflexi bacterium]|nr:glycosyltransferase family 39 protein [Chloroflexota bacterium]
MAYIRAHPWLSAFAAVTGLLLGLGIGLPLSRGQFGAVVLIAVTSALVGLLFRLLVPNEHRPAVGIALLLGLGLRFASAAVLYFGAEALGRTVFSSTVPIYYVVGDDASYAELSWGVLQWMQGRPDPRFFPVSWFGQAYLIGSFFFLELFVFWIFGPVMLHIQIVNAALGGATVLLVYGIASRLLGARPALLSTFAVALLPSIVLWNSVGLKDSLALALIAAVLWLFLRFQERPRWPLMLVIFVTLIPIETTRRYLYVVLSGLFPVAVALTPRLALPRRIRMTAGAALLAFVLLSLGAAAGQGTYGIPTGFATFEAIRLGMGEGARTSYADPRAIVVNTGDRFVVVDADRTPAPTLQPSATPAPTLQPSATPAPTLQP